MNDEDQNEGRMSRWSKRKLAVAKDEAAVIEPLEVTEDEEALLKEEARLLANREAAESVDLETLNDESDFSVFMKDGVPDFLKKQAMAILWRSNPIFANVDGLVDYDDDFGSPDLIMKTFKSAYQAGRGYLDLFKEDEEGEETESASLENGDAVEEMQKAETSEDGEEPVEDEALADVQLEETGVVEAQFENADDQVLVEDLTENVELQPVRMVSLRKRLELEA